MLFVVMLGGYHPLAKIEVHDIAFSEASDIHQAIPSLRSQWFGAQDGLHVDSWMQVDGVDGYRIEFNHRPPRPGDPRLYFVNIGGYEEGVFGELHNYFLVAAVNSTDAKRMAKQKANSRWLLPHVDAVQEVDDCFRIRLIDGLYLRLVPGRHNSIKFSNDYFVI